MTRARFVSPLGHGEVCPFCGRRQEPPGPELPDAKLTLERKLAAMHERLIEKEALMAERDAVAAERAEPPRRLHVTG